ncbi:acid phosphatase [Crucibulum laeve]|uniref:Acid phosphatase n=1 Tax=Crucibulum laeve TaxID=68775 RepID=A0A5C3LM47_9AGAR|nr:acid phosphatase [Crucibulum laeve]
MILSSFFLAGICATSNLIKGKVFDRFVTIWLENTDFDDALADPSLSALAKQGIELNNYFAVTHPSEPNYVASVGGEYFGMDNDNLNRIPENISSIVDLLEEKSISWGEYQQDMPETGFQGFSFNNPVTGAGDYVRKHDPLIIFDSVANNSGRSSNIKNFTLFNEDLANNKLPQWMFITPNLTSDGHDTNVTVAGTFTKSFLEPLLKNKNFNGDRTLVLITFDENDNHLIGNRVRSILLGSAVPRNLIGTSDNYYYDHYSEISTMQANWGLSTLGRYDVGANVFDMVAKHTGDRLRDADLDATFLNGSYPGLFNSVTKAPLPIPNTKLVVNGRRVLKKVVDIWGAPVLQKCTVYTGSLQIPSAGQPPVLPDGC